MITRPPDSADMSPQDTDLRLITEERARAIYERIRSIPQSDGSLNVVVRAMWSGELRWARNRVTLTSDRRDLTVVIERYSRIGGSRVITNQVDDAALQAAVNAAERQMKYGGGAQSGWYDGATWMPPRLPYPDTPIWSDSTFTVTPRQRVELGNFLRTGAEAKGMLSAGFLQMRVGEFCTYRNDDTSVRQNVAPEDNLRGTGADRTARVGVYSRHTEAQCSMTVRHPKGSGSGWAGLSGYNWSVFDTKHLAEEALRKCEASLDPVAIEPGRYMVILEPPAVVALVDWMMIALYDRTFNEDPKEDSPAPFRYGKDPALGIVRSKLGLKIMDERISITSDPMNPTLGVLPALGLGPVTWIEQGVLKTLGYDRDVSVKKYALAQLNLNLPAFGGGFRISGGNATIDEMIATTKRGLLVSRFSNLAQIDQRSLLQSGVTRDGLWLIENGRISKAVKNMRWTDSPLFVLNNVEQLGVPVPVFHPASFGLSPAVVPPVQSRDFAFVATSDAI